MTAIEAGHVRTEIRLEGVFDIAAARRVAVALDEARYAEVRIDLTAVQEFHDFAVALLGETISSRRAPTEVVGLLEQHQRLLRHLGVEGAAADRSSGAADGTRDAADGTRGAADGTRGAADGARGAADGTRDAALT